jgi:hypothetical protein
MSIFAYAQYYRLGRCLRTEHNDQNILIVRQKVLFAIMQPYTVMIRSAETMHKDDVYN